MLRALRFAAKLDFSIHPDTKAPIPKLAWMLDAVPPARLFDEVNKMFLSGHATAAFNLLTEMGLLEHLFPDLAEVYAEEPDGNAMNLLRLGLQGTDARVREDKSVTPTFLFAVLLWPAIQRAVAKAPKVAGAEFHELLNACERVTLRQQSRVAVPRRFTLPLREIVALQPRFERRDGKRALRLLEHPRFRAAYDFLLLRVAAGDADAELGQWWTEIQTLSPEERLVKIEGGGSNEVRESSPRPRRRRRRRRPPTA